MDRAPHALLVWPQIDGRDAGPFVLDTGANALTITSRAARRLGLDVIGRANLQGHHDTAVFAAHELRLGPVTLRGPRLVGMDLPMSALMFGRSVDGFVGHDLLAAAVVELDFAGGWLGLHDPATFTLSAEPCMAGAAAAWMPLQMRRRLPVVPMRYEGDGEGLFIIDTGADNAVWLFEGAVEAGGLLDGRPTRRRTIAHLGAASRVERGRLAWIELGSTRLDDVEADFSLEPMPLLPEPGDVRGLIGMGVLERFRVVLDLSGRRAAFLPPGSPWR